MGHGVDYVGNSSLKYGRAMLSSMYRCVASAGSIFHDLVNMALNALIEALFFSPKCNRCLFCMDLPGLAGGELALSRPLAMAAGGIKEGKGGRKDEKESKGEEDAAHPKKLSKVGAYACLM